MEIVENYLPVDIDAFLSRPLFCFLSQRGDGGARVSPLWYLWDPEAETCWMVAQLAGRSYPERVRQYPDSALAVVDFDPYAGRVGHVGMRGRASLEPWDDAVADRLLRRYLGPDRSAWDEGFRGLDGDGYRLLRFDPATVVARGGTHDTGLRRTDDETEE